MMKDTLRRVGRVEGSAWRTVLVAVIAVATTALVTSAWGRPTVAVEDVLRTRRVEVVDASGQVRAVLGAREDDEFGLWLNDEDGRAAIKLSVRMIGWGSEREPMKALVVHDSRGAVRVSVSYSPSRGAAVGVVGNTLQTAALIRAREDEAALEALGKNAAISVQGEESKVEVQGEESRLQVHSGLGPGAGVTVVAAPEGAALLASDARALPRVVLGIGPDNRVGFVMLDEEQQPEFEVPPGMAEKLKKVDQDEGSEEGKD